MKISIILSMALISFHAISQPVIREFKDLLGKHYWEVTKEIISQGFPKIDVNSIEFHPTIIKNGDTIMAETGKFEDLLAKKFTICFMRNQCDHKYCEGELWNVIINYNYSSLNTMISMMNSAYGENKNFIWYEYKNISVIKYKLTTTNEDFYISMMMLPE